MARKIKKEPEDLSFEEALQRLETLVESLEEGKLPLEEAIATYEEGSTLRRICEKQLQEAERRIELLARDSNGEISLVPLEQQEIRSE